MSLELTYSKRLLQSGKGVVAWQRFARFRQAARQIKLFSDSQPLETIIDLGAADGIALPFLSPLARRVISLNYYHFQCEEFQSNYPNEFVVNADGQKQPFQDKCVDTVVSLEALHLVPSPESRMGCINEIFRVLKPNGFFVCSIPIEIGIPALIKYIGRKYAKSELEGITFALMLKHCFHHFFDLSKLDNGRQVGFNAYRFADQVSKHFTILKRIYIPLPYPFFTNLMLVCIKKI